MFIYIFFRVCKNPNPPKELVMSAIDTLHIAILENLASINNNISVISNQFIINIFNYILHVSLLNQCHTVKYCQHSVFFCCIFFLNVPGLSVPVILSQFSRHLQRNSISLIFSNLQFLQHCYSSQHLGL